MSLDIAALGLRLDASGIVAGGQVADSALQGVGASAEQAERKLASASTSARTTTQAFVESATRTKAVLETQLNTLTALTDGWASANATAKDIAIKLGDAIASEGRMASATAQQIKQLADAQAVMAGSATQATAQVTDATRAMTLKQIEAIAINEKLGQSAEVAFTGVGRIRQGLVSLVASATGTIPVLDRIGASLLTMGAGGGIALGVIAGIAAIALGYEKLTENSRKAAEAQDKLTASLQKWYETKRNGEAGDRQKEVAAQLKTIAEQQAEVDKLTARLNSPTLQGSEAGESAAVAIEKKIADLKKLIQAERDAIGEGNADITRTLTEGFVRQQGEESSNLAKLIETHHATEAERARAIALLKQDQALIETYSKPPADASPDTRAVLLKASAELAEQAKTLDAALNPSLAHQAVARNEVIDALEKQLEAIRKLNTEDNAATLKARDQTLLITAEGEARDYLTNRLKAQEQEQAALAQYAGNPVALADARAAIEAEKASNDERARTKQLLADQTEAQLLLDESGQRAAATAAKNAKETSAGLAEGLKLYRETEKEAAHLSATIEKDLLRSIVQLTSGGITSFQSFFRVVESGAIRIAEAVEQSANKQQEIYTKSAKAGQDAENKIMEERLEHLRKLQVITSGISAALAGGSAGYGIGQQTSGSLNAAGAGGIAGALTGYEVLGPLGAVIGGFTGVIGGLLGAAEAHKAAAKAIEDASKQLATNIASYTSGNGVASALADNQAKHDALLLQAQQLVESRGAQALKDGHPSDIGAIITSGARDAAAINAAEGANAIKIAVDFWAGITQGLNALNGPAGAYANSVAAIKKSYDDNLVSADAIAKANGLAGASDSDRAKLLALETAQLEAAAKAEQERTTQLQFSLDARQAYAKGLTAEGDAIARRAQEDKELFDAEQAGYTAAQLAQLKYIQSLEDVAAAAKKASDAARSLQDVQSETAHLTATSQSQRDALDLMDLQIKQAREYNDLKAAGASAELLAALTLKDVAEDTALILKQAQAAIDQSNSDIANAIGGGHISGAAGLAAEAQNFGFTGLSDTQISALYTDPTQGALTDAQRQTNKNIDQYLADEKRWGPQLADAVSALASGGTPASHPATEAVSYAARNLSEITGNRMADYLASIYIVEKEIRDAVTGRLTGTARSLLAASSLSAPSSPSVDWPALNAWLSSVSTRQPTSPASLQQAQSTQAAPRAPITVAIQVAFDPLSGATIPRSQLRALVGQIKDELLNELAQDAADARIRTGNPLVQGA